MSRLFAIAWVVAYGAVGIAQADTPTPATLDLARQILRSDGSYDAIAAAISGKRSSDIKSVAKLLSMNDARATLFVDKYWIPEMKARLQDFVDVGAEIYASKMTPADMQSVATFLQSPAGQRMVVAQSETSRELTTGVRAWQHGVMVDALKKFTQDSAAGIVH